MRAALVVALCAVALVGCGGDASDEDAASEPPAWSHDPDDTTLGPVVWGQLDHSFDDCATGRRQSPIDIADTVPADLPPLELDYSAVPLVVENTGHVIEVPMPESSDLSLSIGDDEYRLVQYHFHVPSEHTVDGESQAGEVHLVHESDAGDLAVVGILLDEQQPPSPLVDAVVESAPEEAGEEVEVDREASPLELVPGDSGSVVGAYLTYPGSLTTPGCDEGVRWIVLSSPLGMSGSAAERLHELVAGFPGYDGYESNNRPTQPLNEREVQRAGG